jgi:hypothetical protein
VVAAAVGKELLVRLQQVLLALAAQEYFTFSTRRHYERINL